MSRIGLAARRQACKRTMSVRFPASALLSLQNCVILCLLSALSRRVGALQISIIIIIKRSAAIGQGVVRIRTFL